MKYGMVLRFAVISIGFAGTVLLVLPVRPAVAHRTEVTGDVAGTWHVEPNHTPRSGEPATVWIALTRKGGNVLPLEQASCQLKIYDVPRRQGAEPVLKPVLRAISIEQYQGIPGAEVVFPRTGLYQLELGCTPKVEEDFAPFQMTYEVTVASGSAPPASATASPQPKTTTSPLTATASPESTRQSNQPDVSPLVYVLGAIAAIVILGLGVLKLRARE